MNGYTSNRSKECALKFNLEYSKELRELRNDYPLALDKTEIKKQILSSYQLKISNFHNFPIGKVKKLIPNFFDKEKYVLHYNDLQLYLRLRLKLKSTSQVRI